jgi:large subunit ribosomal protein L5e
MVFVKVIKNKAYFKRYQVKYRRRREGKTDYRARRAMVLQDKTKFGAPKYRLVVRISNKDIITQVVHAKTIGDDVIASAYSHELKDYGVPVGHTNYAAAYATGLLLARRTLTKLGIADKFEGNKDVDGKYVAVRTKKEDQGDDENRFPFKAIMDVGLARTTTGARIFGAMKGAIDGGIAVPHRPNRFPGFDKAKDTLDAKVHRDHIFGKHVADWMKETKDIKAQNPDDKISQFSNFEKNKITADGLEAMYKKAHAEIRANPNKKTKKAAKGGKSKAYNQKKLSKSEKRANAKKKIATLRERLGK